MVDLAIVTCSQQKNIALSVFFCLYGTMLGKMKRKYTLSDKGRAKIIATTKRMWQIIAPRDRKIIAASGGRAKAANMTEEQRKEHGRKMAGAKKKFSPVVPIPKQE